MKNLVKNLIREEDGQGLVEYGLIIAAVALAVLVALWAFGDDIVAIFEDIGGKLSTERPPA